jgi:hypothetical protein
MGVASENGRWRSQWGVASENATIAVGGAVWAVLAVASENATIAVGGRKKLSPGQFWVLGVASENATIPVGGRKKLSPGRKKLSAIPAVGPSG